MDADDLGRMLGWEFSLMTAAVRLINSGLLDELPTLRIQFSHFAGGIGRYLGRIRGFQQRDKWATAKIPRHGRQPGQPFDHYLDHRLFYDIAGWAGPDHAAEWGADWVRFGIEELAFSQLVFATDYPQAVREASEVAAYVEAVRGLSGNGRALVAGANAEKLIPDLGRRLATRQPSPVSVRA
jgi:predicted TIM-barrel fold metal-dependent hydrolase